MPKPSGTEIPFSAILWEVSQAAVSSQRPDLGRAYAFQSTTWGDLVRRWIYKTEPPQRYQLSDIKVPVQHGSDLQTRLHALEHTGIIRTRYPSVELPYTDQSVYGGSLTLQGYWPAELHDGIVTASTAEPALFQMQLHTSRDTVYNTTLTVENFLYSQEDIEWTDLRVPSSHHSELAIDAKGFERALGFLSLVED